MFERGVDQALEFGDQLVHAFGRKIEPEELDGDEAIAIRFVRTEHRTQRTRTDLMKHAKWTEGIRERRADSFRVQR